VSSPVVGTIARSQATGSNRTIETLDAQVLRMFVLVRDAIASATNVFLATDRDAARSLIQSDQLIDALHEQTEWSVIEELIRGGIDTVRQRRLLVILRILPELERSGDLAEHIASHAAQGLSNWLTPRARSVVKQMGALGCEMWRMAADAYAAGDGSIADLLRVRDDEIDDLHVILTAELAAGCASIPVAIEMALVARYFERLGDHAVNITRRLRPITIEPATS
jgi:phosphate transport system protein